MDTSDSDDCFGDRNKQKREDRENIKTVERALNEINAYTKNDLKSIEDCVKYVKRLYDNSKKQSKRSTSDKETVDLIDKIEDLKDVIKSNERKFTRKLEKKDSEMEELKEELESLEKAKSPKDNKEKFQLKELKESNAILEDNLKEKDDVCAGLERKIKTLTKKINSLTEEKETLSEKFEENESHMKRKINELKEIISNKHNEVEDAISKSEKNLKEKQCAITTITEKMVSKNTENELLDRKLAEKAVELDECRKDLQNEKRKSNDLENKLILSEKKMKQLEAEIGNNRINDFHQKNKTESWHPNWWNRHIKETKTIQIECPNCQRMYNVNRIRDHIENCAYNFYG